MSADNYGIVHRTEKGFGLSMFFASDKIEKHDLSLPYFTSSRLDAVTSYADGEYFEYGWSFEDNLQKELVDGIDWY